MDPLARSSIAMRRPSHLIWINVFYLFCFTTLSRCLDTNDIQSYLRNVQISTDVLDGAEHPEESSRHFWGIQDMVATADRVFKFTLPESVFSKSSSRVKVSICSIYWQLRLWNAVCFLAVYIPPMFMTC